jgi:hypothetical protein
MLQYMNTFWRWHHWMRTEVFGAVMLCHWVTVVGPWKRNSACFFRVKQSKMTGVQHNCCESLTSVKPLDFNIWQGWVVNFTPMPLYPLPPQRRKTPGTQRIGSWVGLKDSLDVSGTRNIACCCWELNPRLSSWYMCLCYAEWWQHVKGAWTNEHSCSCGACMEPTVAYVHQWTWAMCMPVVA